MVTATGAGSGLGAGYKYANTDPTKQPLTTATVLLSLGQLAAAVQALGAWVGWAVAGAGRAGSGVRCWHAVFTVTWPGGVCV